MSRKRPFCHERILQMIREAGGEMTRGEIRKRLQAEGYGYYCIFEAHRRLAERGLAEYIGAGQSPNQILRLPADEAGKAGGSGEDMENELRGDSRAPEEI